MDLGNITIDSHNHCPNRSDNFTQFIDRHKGLSEVYEQYTIRINLDRIIRPIWFILGIPGTLISFYIWTQPRMRQSSGIYLAALGLVDFAFFICQIPFFLETAWDITSINYPVVCELYSSVNMFLQYMSPLLTLAFTVERYLAICHPYASERMFTSCRSFKTTMAIALLSGSIASLQAYFFQYQPENKSFMCSRRPEIIDQHTWQSSFYSFWDLTTELVIFGLTPIAILILNVFVIHETRRASRSIPRAVQQPLSRPSNSSLTSVSRKTVAGVPNATLTTFTLLCISFYLIFATLPVTICQVLLHWFWIGDECLTDLEVSEDSDWQKHFIFVNARSIIDLLAVSHYAAKFYIYMATGKQFRKECRLLFNRCISRRSSSL